ncbi:MAG: GrpB family protein [Clostridiales bacterium]|nr:GrpB family protein [Clostridiales bacterium]
MIGLKKGTVALYPHEKAWEAEAKKTIGVLRDIFGDTAEDIKHVGSTSVPSIMAKPIIDIAVAVRDLSSVRALIPSLRDAGFYFRPDSFDTQLLFACGSYYDGTGDLQTHFIHVVEAGGTEWQNYINFRDYLRAFPDVAKEYEALKCRLAAERPEDSGREHYLAGKEPFITYCIRKATVWSFLGKMIHIEIDRPIGYVHKKGNYTLVYPINYGYIPGIIGGDGEELDVYLLGVDTPVKEADCRVIGIVHRKNDVEDKLIAAPDGMTFTREEAAEAVNFQEKWYDSEIEMAEKALLRRNMMLPSEVMFAFGK